MTRTLGNGPPDTSTSPPGTSTGPPSAGEPPAGLIYDPGTGGLQEQWVHGTRLGREHASVGQHLVEDHGVNPGWVECASDAALHGMHDGKHRSIWAYAIDLPHDLKVIPDEPRVD